MMQLDIWQAIGAPQVAEINAMISVIIAQRRDRHQRRMRWALLIIITFLTTFSLLIPVFAYSLTGNPLVLTSVVGSIPLSFAWTRITKSVFPLNKREHERELAKITYGIKKNQH